MGRVKLNPVDNELSPCIKVILSDGMAHNDLVLLKVINCRDDRELRELEDKLKEEKNGKRKDK